MDEGRVPEDSEKIVRNLRLILSYDGTDFAGWQVQPGQPTIQGTLASVIRRLTGENVLPQGSGRTDAGVHALAQVATFSTASPIPTENWIKVLNDSLPASIRVIEVREVPAEFHARKSAMAKTYRYRMHRGDVCPPFLARYVWHYPFPLDEAAMIEAAGAVVGEHDFTSFAAVDPERVERTAPAETLNHKGHPSTSLRAGSGTRRKNAESASNTRRIFASTWVREGDEFVYTVRGNGFLHHMVRNLVGTFLLVGKGTLKVSDVSRILAACDRSAAGATAPASGLVLVAVEYGT
jgi:tRNA pseudouridine38-40 synthase